MFEMVDNQNLQLEKLGFDELNDMHELSLIPPEMEELDAALQDMRSEI